MTSAIKIYCYFPTSPVYVVYVEQTVVSDCFLILHVVAWEVIIMTLNVTEAENVDNVPKKGKTYVQVLVAIVGKILYFFFI